MMPYVVLTQMTGVHSEQALNLALRLPFMVGWLFLLGAVARLLASTTIRAETGNVKFPWVLLLLNPVGLLMTLWQPEALLVGLVILAFALLFEGRPRAAGLVFGLSVTGKY